MHSQRTGVLGGRAALLSLCALYLLIQVAYVLRLPLVMDEFQSAATVADLAQRTPYRDFLPYKTVLGHYLQLPAMLLGSAIWQSLMLVKLEMALLNTAALAGAAALLSRYFAPAAVALGLALTVVMSTFLERSSELRVDMLTAWAGLFSLLLLLGRRWAMAGALAGVSFLISQKGLYFCLAGGVATLVAALPAARGRGISLRPALRFAAGAAAALLAYVLFWALLSSWEAVYRATFVTPQRIAFQVLYEDIRLTYWMQSVGRNPAFYGFALIGILQLALEPERSSDPPRDRGLLAYASVLLALALWHKQPWPYFFVLIVPTLFVLCVSFLDRTLRSASGRRVLGLPLPVAAAYAVLGVLLPLARLPLNLARDSGHQRATVELASCILAPNDTYLAGLDIVYDRRQPVGTLRWIDHPRQQMIGQLDSMALQAIADSVVGAPAKLVIDSYRTRGLPPTLRDRLERDYTSVWGSVRIYGPAVEGGEQMVELHFQGSYSVDAAGGESVRIDGSLVADGSEVELGRGAHRVESKIGVRLRLRVPECEATADPRYRRPADLFPAIYTY